MVHRGVTGPKGKSAMTCSKEYQDLLEGKGVALMDLGLRDVALNHEDTLAALDILEKESIPVLGGDVYLERYGEYEPAYANWAINSRGAETRDDYLRLSWDYSRAYLHNYRTPSGSEPLFVLVVGDPAAIWPVRVGHTSGWCAQAA